jgi:hypothetical protein
MAATTDRDRVIDALREIAPGRPTGRVWGRLETARPDQAQEGNAWAGSVEDIADIVLAAIDRTVPTPGGSMQPSIGCIVHFNHDGECTASIVTGATGGAVTLTLFRLTGPEARLAPTREGTGPGTWHWPERT